MHISSRLTVLSACFVMGISIWQSGAMAVDPAPAMSKDEVESRIFERQQIMTQLQEDSETLGDIVAGIQPSSKLASTTRAIAKGARESLEAFKTPIPGGRSKPEVWTNNADFMQKMSVFSREADEMAKLGEAGNIPAVTEKLVAALPCKECHDTFRVPKKTQQ